MSEIIKFALAIYRIIILYSSSTRAISFSGFPIQGQSILFMYTQYDLPSTEKYACLR